MPGEKTPHQGVADHCLSDWRVPLALFLLHCLNPSSPVLREPWEGLRRVTAPGTALLPSWHLLPAGATSPQQAPCVPSLPGCTRAAQCPPQSLLGQLRPRSRGPLSCCGPGQWSSWPFLAHLEGSVLSAYRHSHTVGTSAASCLLGLTAAVPGPVPMRFRLSWCARWSVPAPPSHQPVSSEVPTPSPQSAHTL